VRGDLKGKWEENEGKSVVRRLFLLRSRESPQEIFALY
jgi:hypothetical protein